MVYGGRMSGDNETSTADPPVPGERLGAYLDQSGAQAMATLLDAPEGRRSKTDIVIRALKVLAEVERIQRHGAIYVKEHDQDTLTRVRFL